MGTWGPGIFSDDEAADARGDWRRAVIDGADLGAATDHILRDYRDSEPGPGQDAYAANVWIALAAAQFETGRLTDRVRDRALAFLAHGGEGAGGEARVPTCQGVELPAYIAGKSTGVVDLTTSAVGNSTHGLAPRPNPPP